MQQQPMIYTSQPESPQMILDPSLLIEHGNSPTAIILSIAILIWVLRPVLMRQSGGSK